MLKQGFDILGNQETASVHPSIPWSPLAPP